MQRRKVAGMVKVGRSRVLMRTGTTVQRDRRTRRAGEVVRREVEAGLEERGRG